MLRSLLSANHLGILSILIGACLATVAAHMIFPPAGVAVAAFEFVVTGYTILYLEAKRAIARQPATSI